MFMYMNIPSIFNRVNNWHEFNEALVPLNTKQKGDAFELLTKIYFEIDHKYSNYDNIWLLSEVPKKDLEIIGLESRDLGIDLIAKLGNEYHAIQCKYRADKQSSVTLGDVSTFLSNLGGYEKLTAGFICSSAVSTSKNYDDIKKKPVSKLLHDTWSNLNDSFFNRVRSYLKKEKYSPEPYYPFPHQEKATNKAYEHFVTNKETRGKLIFPCGAGKSLTGFWMMEKLDAFSTVIAVPSLSLVKQTLDVYLKEIVARRVKVNWLCICSDEGIGSNSEIKFKTEDIGVPCKTDPEYIKGWLKENKDSRNIIFTTYQSSKLIADISKELNHTFDLGILDEAHKTVGGSDKLFSYLLFEKNISIKSRIYMTATERFYKGSKDDIVSMDDVDIYGEVFAQMSFKEAIDGDLLTDYKIITIDVKKSEIAEFIKDNGLVESNKVWKKETEARSLASMLALRKAMKQFPIKNAVSFHSSIEKARRNKELHTDITSNYGYKAIDTYTVSGKDSTSKRNDIIKEFASSKKALITNARCLTEGVDVPNIDCIVFADPRKSKVDIVQALGRALRKKKGKDWGYVILPVIYDGVTNEIDNDNFNEILSIVRGLAANDERIIEYFKDKSLPKSGQKGGGAEVFSMITETLSESDFAEQLNIRIWEKLSRFNWMPFEEARNIAQSFKLKNWNEWRLLDKSKMPLNIPHEPNSVYVNKGWVNWGHWLGTNNTSTHNRKYLSFNEARKFVRGLKLKNGAEWKRFCKSKNMPSNIPVSARKVYKEDGFISMDDWLGTGKVSKMKRRYLSYEDAQKVVATLNLKSEKDWNEKVMNKELPLNIPSKPYRTYKDMGWKGMGHWLGTGRVANFNKVYRHYSLARKYALKLNLKSRTEWVKLYKSGVIPKDIPISVESSYKNKGWLSWKHFLGYTRVPNNKREYLDFNKAREIVRNQNLQNQKEWALYCKTSRPENIPSSPNSVYKNSGWISLGDWIGTNKVAAKNISFKSLKDAKEYVFNLNIKTWKEWVLYCKSGQKPKDIPSNPRVVYKNDGWIGLADFFGKDKTAK